MTKEPRLAVDELCEKASKAVDGPEDAASGHFGTLMLRNNVQMLRMSARWRKSEKVKTFKVDIRFHARRLDR